MDLRQVLNIAYAIAMEAHMGQVDNTGKPYFNHVLKVSQRCKTLKGKICGMLHDVLEDCPTWTEMELIRRGIPEDLVNVLVLLNKGENEKYEDYVKRISTNPIAIEVKLSDLKHNMDLTRNKTGLTSKEIERTLKYHRHYVLLYKELNKLEDEDI